jgi:hypothetical protein
LRNERSELVRAYPTGGLPLGPFDRFEQFLFVRVNLHDRTPNEVMSGGLLARDVRLQEHRVLVLHERHQEHVVVTLDDEDSLVGVPIGALVFQDVEQAAALDVEDDVLESDGAIRLELRVLRVAKRSTSLLSAQHNVYLIGTHWHRLQCARQCAQTRSKNGQSGPNANQRLNKKRA